MLRVVCWLWRDPGYRWNDRFLYTADHVNRLRSMVARNLHMPHEFVCITDTPEGIASDIRVVPYWPDLRDMGCCWSRIKVFAPEMAEVIGPRFVSIDLDCVVTGDLTPLFDRPEDFIIWQDVDPRQPYCGSMFMMTAGARAQVWTDFDRNLSPERVKAGDFIGSDQGWFAECLGPGEAMWTKDDGVLSFRVNIEKRTKMPGRAKRLGHYGGLPDHARIVFFHGPYDPSESAVQDRHPWIQQHWR